MIEVKTRSGKERKFTFPCIVVGKNTGVMFLMLEQRAGVCLDQGKSIRYETGKYYEHMQHLNDAQIDLFDGEVILKNK